MRNHPSLIVIGSDKNLGQCVIERTKHHHLVYSQHLGNSSAYQQLSEQEANDIVDDAVAEFCSLYSKVKREKELKLRSTCFYESDITCIEREMLQATR